MEGFASSLYMFVLGLEMEPLAILRPTGPEAKIACAGIASTWAFFALLYFVFNPKPTFTTQTNEAHPSRVLAAFAVMFSAASSPMVTRLITELKLGQSEIGRRAIRAGLANDLVCTLLMIIMITIREKNKQIFLIFTWVGIEMLIVVFVMRHVFKWVDNRNPEGKAMKGVDTAIILILTQLFCHSMGPLQYDSKLNSFLVGLALPRHGRMSNFLISKINYLLTGFIFPLYLSMMGLNLDLRHFNVDVDDNGHITKGKAHVNLARLVVITLVATVGKLVGTLLVSMHYGLHWLEAVTLGVLLSMKGYFQIFFSMHGKNRGFMTDQAFVLMVSVVIVSIVYVPFLISYIVRHVRKLKGGGQAVMGIQWYNTSKELRLTIGLHGPQNAAASMNIVHSLRSASDAGVVLYATDMIELTEQNEASLIYRQGADAIMVADSAVIELRSQIAAALDATHDFTSHQDIKLFRNLAVSSFSEMHNDFCNGAQDSLSLLIILPFHIVYHLDGTSDVSHVGFRTVNEKILESAPCSVAILVDRGLSQHCNLSPVAAVDPSASSSSLHLHLHSHSQLKSLNIVMIFIGGPDDREALACAGMMVHNPFVKMVVIRIIPDTEAIEAEGGRHLLATIPMQEQEMQVDDQYFADFYEHYISNGRVEYIEKHVTNGPQAVTILRKLEGEHHLFIVGRGEKRNSVLTAGLSEWAEYPELGPIGDVLAQPEFPVKASVLVVQQFDPNRSSTFVKDEFAL